MPSVQHESDNDVAVFTDASNPIEVQLSNQVVDYWAGMARGGSPNSAAAAGATAHVHWPEYDPSGAQETMVFGSGAPSAGMPQGHVRKAKCDFWDAQFAKALAQHTPP